MMIITYYYSLLLLVLVHSLWFFLETFDSKRWLFQTSKGWSVPLLISVVVVSDLSIVVAGAINSKCGKAHPFRRRVDGFIGTNIHPKTWIRNGRFFFGSWMIPASLILWYRGSNWRNQHVVYVYRYTWGVWTFTFVCFPWICEVWGFKGISLEKVSSTFLRIQSTKRVWSLDGEVDILYHRGMSKALSQIFWTINSMTSPNQFHQIHLKHPSNRLLRLTSEDDEFRQNMQRNLASQL